MFLNDGKKLPPFPPGESPQMLQKSLVLLFISSYISVMAVSLILLIPGILKNINYTYMCVYIWYKHNESSFHDWTVQKIKINRSPLGIFPGKNYLDFMISRLLAKILLAWKTYSFIYNLSIINEKQYCVIHSGSYIKLLF